MTLKFNKNSLLYGTFVLTIANIFVRLLGFIYRIFLSRMIGPQGMGLVQLIFPLYMITITLTASGIPIAVSRIVSQRKAIGDIRGIKRTVFISLLMVIVISIFLCFLVIINADKIATHLFKDTRTHSAILVFFPCILITGLGAVLKGYFYGVKNIHPPALSEIIEQIVRMVLVVAILLWIPSLSVQASTAVVILGMVIGELASLLYLHYYYHQSMKVNFHSIQTPASALLFKNILIIAIPITLTRLVSSLMMAANSILIPRRLMAGGMANSEAVGAFGIISGMVMPLLFLPFTIISALSVVIIPNLSENVMLKNWTNIRDKVSKSIFITCLTAFGSMALIIPLAHVIGIVLYQQPAVGKFLIPLSYSMIFFCLQHSLNSILNGLGKQNRAALHFMIGGIIQLICTYFLVAHPDFRIYGFIIGFFFSSMIVSFLNFIAVIQITKLQIQFTKWFLKPGLVSLLTALVIRLTFLFLVNHEISYGLSLITAVPIGIIALMVMLFQTGSLPLWLLKEINKKFHTNTPSLF
ncbi:MAG: stage sporulation protein [Clostridiales bacterium]|jgi:stage V sporulation protein B|nr:stage sporulation protein [Clostridiales bacterium]